MRARYALAVLVVASAAIRFAAALGVDAPWISPDEMAYGLLGRSFWDNGQMQILNGGSRFYGLYPVVAGAPLAAFGPATGLAVLQALQAILVSSTIVVVFIWARRLAGQRWALAAATLTALLPGLAYSGLIMSEAAFVPAATLALWLLARALVEPSRTNQLLVLAGLALAISMRYQGIVLLPALVGSVCLMAVFARDRSVLRQFAPTWWVLGAVAALWAVVSVAGSGTTLLGSYSVVGDGGYSLVSVLRWSLRHAGDVFLLVFGAPLIAAFILAVGAVRGREREPAVRALLAVSLAYGICVVVEVGVFASKFVGHLAERDLISLAPPLLVAFAVWLSRGLPRPQPTAAIVALVVAIPALLLPVRTLVTTFAIPDAFTVIPLWDLLQRTSAGTLEHVWLAGVLAAVALTLLVPRRAVVLLVALVAASLGASSVLAQRKIEIRASADRHSFFGTASARWIDRAADGPVIYLDDADFFWNAAWQTAFWNTRVSAIATLGPTEGQLPGRPIALSPRSDGRLTELSGTRLIVARDSVTFVGKRLARIAASDVEPGLTLWRTPSTPTLSTWRAGLQTNDDNLVHRVTFTVFNCRSGRLELTLHSFGGAPAVSLSANGLRPTRIALQQNSLTRGFVAARGVNGRCVFIIIPSGDVAAPRIRFVQTAAEAIGPTTQFTQTGRDSLEETRRRVAYCINGRFAMRQAGTYAGATPALFVAGTGLTCGVPPGYTQHGFAGADLGVPAETYPYYTP